MIEKIEKYYQPQPEERIHIYVDREKLLANPNVQAQLEYIRKRTEELRDTQVESLREMYERWDREHDSEEARETLEVILKSLAENRRGYSTPCYMALRTQMLLG